MIEQILNYIHNYFEKETFTGTFTISNGDVNVDFLQDGQYFMIVGSVFNDGVHEYLAGDLVDEIFDGEIRAMAVPSAVVALKNEIETWVANENNNANSPYTSESFGGYSYSKGTKKTSGGVSVPISWEDVFGRRLNHWRKIS